MHQPTRRGLVICLRCVAAVLLALSGGAAQSATKGGFASDPSPQPEANPPFKYTNHLASATSPYLLQHAHNPVDWYPWGPEAMERAKRENKPIFLSIGYSTCYWCHVMEREVFENEAIAALMNERFVCIKVDREERPDLDEIYMAATQVMTQRGGWPNNLFLTPDLKPFFAGTYFGATDQPGRPGFGTIVTRLGDAWKTERDQVNEVSGHVADAIRDVLAGRLASLPRATLDAALVDKVVRQLAAAYDPVDGGFGLAPKFPSGFDYPFLLDVHASRVAEGRKDEGTLAMVTGTLDAMAAGGIHDHVGGGFHRYSTDAQWRVPHFEKMLYNQAQLAVAYLDAYAATGDTAYEHTARGIFRFVGETFTGPEGQCSSALDAETDAVEGAYYVWTRDEIVGALGEADAERFWSAFDLADVPVFPGHLHPEGGVLFRKRGEATTLPDTDLDTMLSRLAAVRQERKLPRLDDKAIAAWNGMMIDAYARGAEVLGDDAYRAAAERAATFVLEHMLAPGGRLIRTVRMTADVNADAPAQEGFLEDYAFVIRGLLALHRIEPDAAQRARWLDAARSLEAAADELFWDADGGGYFFATPQPDLIARGKDPSDGATPGGNSVMAHDLIDLYFATGDPAYRDRAGAVLDAFSGAMSQSPRGSIHMMHALERYLALAPEPAAPATPAPLPPSAAATAPHVRLSAAVAPGTLAPGGSATVTLTLDIDAGWHVQANPVTLPDLIATSMDVRGDLPILVTRIDYPSGRALTTGPEGAAARIYDGAVTIAATIALPGSATPTPGPALLRVLAKFQVCDDTSCLAPAERIIEVPVMIERAPKPR